MASARPKSHFTRSLSPELRYVLRPTLRTFSGTSTPPQSLFDSGLHLIRSCSCLLPSLMVSPPASCHRRCSHTRRHSLTHCKLRSHRGIQGEFCAGLLPPGPVGEGAQDCRAPGAFRHNSIPRRTALAMLTPSPSRAAEGGDTQHLVRHEPRANPSDPCPHRCLYSAQQTASPMSVRLRCLFSIGRHNARGTGKETLVKGGQVQADQRAPSLDHPGRMRLPRGVLRVGPDPPPPRTPHAIEEHAPGVQQPAQSWQRPVGPSS